MLVMIHDVLLKSTKIVLQLFLGETNIQISRMSISNVKKIENNKISTLNWKKELIRDVNKMGCHHKLQ